MQGYILPIWPIVVDVDLGHLAEEVFGSFLYFKVTVFSLFILYSLEENNNPHFFFFFWPCYACGILVPWPGIEPSPPAAEAWSLNHWTVREVPQSTLARSGKLCSISLNVRHLHKLFAVFLNTKFVYSLQVINNSILDLLKNYNSRASLVVQWLRIHLPMRGTRVRVLVREDPTRHGATKPVHHNYWACMPQLLKPVRLEPMLRNKRRHSNEKPVHRNEDPMQPKIN